MQNIQQIIYLNTCQALNLNSTTQNMQILERSTFNNYKLSKLFQHLKEVTRTINAIPNTF